MAAIVTGGAGGLGTAIAAAFVARHIDVALWDRAETGAAVQAVATGTARVAGIECDITDSAQVASAWAETELTVGAVEQIVNCAGVFTPTPIGRLSDAQWARTVGINLTGAFYLCRRAAAAWVDTGVSGAIVNIASTAALKAPPAGVADYASTKVGLVGLTTHLAVELGPHGIRTNAVCPGQFRSPLNEARLAEPGAEERSVARIPLGRIGMPADIAAVVVHLALDATYVNGAVVAVDAGVTSRM